MERIADTEFDKLELKIGLITGGCIHPQDEQFLVLSVNCGERDSTNLPYDRHICVDIRKEFENEIYKLMGKQVVVITNLKPKVIKGIESNSTILTAKDYFDNKTLIMPQGSTFPGARVQ